MQRSLLFLLYVATCALFAMFPLAYASPNQLPQVDLNKIAAMIAAGEPQEQVQAAWERLAAKHKGDPLDKAIEHIIKESQRLAEKEIKTAEAKVKRFEGGKKRIQSEIERLHKASEQMQKGKSGVRLKQKMVLKDTDGIALKDTGSELTSLSELSQEEGKLRDSLSDVDNDIRRASEELQGILQKRQQILQSAPELSAALRDTAAGVSHTPARQPALAHTPTSLSGPAPSALVTAPDLVTSAAPVTDADAAAQHPAGEGRLAAIPGLRTLTPQQLAAKKIMLAPGIEFKAHDYIMATTFRSNAKFKNAFESGFQNRFLTRPAQYTEEVQESDDRMVVTRTMVLDMKNPCDPGLEQQGFSFCFKRTNKAMKKETKSHLDNERRKMQEQLMALSTGSEADKLKAALKMSDEQLLDYLLNRQTRKEIVHQSIIPYLAYEHGKVPNMDLANMRQPLSRANLLNVRPEAPGMPDQAGEQIRLQPPTVTDVAPRRGANWEEITIRGTGLDRVLEVLLVPLDNSIPEGFRLNIQSKSPDRLIVAGEAPGVAHTIVLRWSRGNVEAGVYQVAWIPEKYIPPAPGPYTWVQTRDIDAKFMTGFTYGRPSTDCLGISFSSAYFVKLCSSVGMNYGIRAPFKVTGSAVIDMVYGPGDSGSKIPYPAQTGQLCSNIPTEGERARQYAPLCAQRAKVTLNAQGVNGNRDFYRAVGMPEEKILDGKEFVLDMDAGVILRGSIAGSDFRYERHAGANFGDHFTPQLGSGSRRLFDQTQSGRSLGLALDLVLGYVSLDPGIAVYGDSGSLSFDVRKNSAKTTGLGDDDLTLGSDTKTLYVEEDHAQGNWGIAIANPRYRLGLSIAPTMKISYGVDLRIYEWNGSFGPYDIDALAVDMGQAVFNNHRGATSEYLLNDLGQRPIIPPPPAH